MIRKVTINSHFTFFLTLHTLRFFFTDITEDVMSVGDIFMAVTMELWSKYPKYQYMSVLHSQRAGASFQPHIHLVYSCTFILQYSHSVTGMQHCHSMYQKRVFFQICHITAFFSDFCFFQIGNLTMALLLFSPSAHKQHRAQRM